MDTIVAISTAPGLGGIGIIRISGTDAFKILLKIFKSKKVKTEDDIVANTIQYGHIIDDEKIVDEVLVSFFKAPHSYTAEDTVEINSHGGTIVMNEILKVVLKNGAKLALPGEFTKRAFINNRIDLTKVEAISSILNAKSERELEISNTMLNGKLYNTINDIKKEVLEILMHIEVSIDYPEYDTQEKDEAEILEVLEKVLNILTKFEQNFDIGSKIQEGIKIAIIGRPNAGKSSLLNLLLNKERAIVTEIEGTTRDSIEETFVVDGLPIKIIDTAGIRDTTEVVEKIGIERALKYAQNSDLIIGIFDVSREFSTDDKKIIELLKNNDGIIILNKVDLPNKLNSEDIKLIEELDKNILKTSIVNKEGYNELLDIIRDKIKHFQLNKDNENIIIHQRQKNIITEAIMYTKQALKDIEILPIDMVSENIQNIVNCLNELTGEDVKEEMLNEIFANFCLGK
ncbi:MAG: tRNA uridine-5-carboxymethylaminomethyl(34) synthesis GTPase MnmE [Clostridium sp.]